MIPYNITERNVTLSVDGKPYIIPSTAPAYTGVIDAIRDNDLTRLRQLVQPKQRIAEVTEGRINFDGKELLFNGEVIHNAIRDRLCFLWERGLDYQPLLRFMDNLMDNPSFRAVNETYKFLEACDLPITSDGHFLAYKKVRNNYLDIHSGTMDNSVGKVLEVPRNQVDEDCNRTCSYGLHVCSQSYLPSFGTWSGSDRVLQVKVNPRDVVAVPIDYNNAKMRVCRYEVVAELDPNDVRMDAFYTDQWGSDVVDEDDNFEDLSTDTAYDEDDDDFDELPGLKFQPDSTVSKPASSPVGKPQVLNEHKVREILRLLDDGELTLVAIANLFGINESTVRKIRDRKIWKHVTI